MVTTSCLSKATEQLETLKHTDKRWRSKRRIRKLVTMHHDRQIEIASRPLIILVGRSSLSDSGVWNKKLNLRHPKIPRKSPPAEQTIRSCSKLPYSQSQAPAIPSQNWSRMPIASSVTLNPSRALPKGHIQKNLSGACRKSVKDYISNPRITLRQHPDLKV